jgi:hypothetical protein
MLLHQGRCSGLTEAVKVARGRHRDSDERGAGIAPAKVQDRPGRLPLRDGLPVLPGLTNNAAAAAAQLLSSCC